MEKRILGKTGERLSVLGFGGIVVMNESQGDADRFVGEAIDRGVNYFDVAPTYGNAQERLGPALEPYRSSVFLACKTTQRSKAGAARELRESLRLLRTDHVDLYQFHGVSKMAEVDEILGPDGAAAAFREAREAGMVRFMGFSAHTEEAACALIERFPFDTVLFPFNFVCWHRNGFGQRVHRMATEHGLGILGLKALAKRRWDEGETRKWPKCWYAPVDTPEEAAVGLRFALSLPVTAAVPSGHMELFRWACDAAKAWEPITDEEAAQWARKAEGTAIFP